jgi:hypothetical protein
LRQLHWSPHFVFWRTTPPIWNSAALQVWSCPTFTAWRYLAFGKPILTTSMRPAGAYVNGIKNEQILASACICGRADLPLRTLRLSNFLRCHRYSGRFMVGCPTTTGHNVIASARYPSSWTIKATSISISQPMLWSFGVCANSSAASIGSISATSTAPCHAMHGLGPRAL